jgi:sterol 3beta-glucosyltransferase
MNISLLTYGSRGDVQPFVALGVALQQAGHHVRLAAPERFAAFVSAHHIDFAPLPGDPAELSRQLVEEAGNNLYKVSKKIRDFAMPIAVEVFDRLEAACVDTDAIVYSFLLAIPGHFIARERHVPDYIAQLQPIMTPTRAFPMMMFPEAPILRGRYNAFTHRLFNQIFWHANRISYKLVRRTHPTLPPNIIWPLRKDNPHRPHQLYAFSERVIPKPHDWGDEAHIIGYWTLQATDNWQPSDTLSDFLAAGDPPIYIGFGSMVSQHIEALMTMSIGALKKINQRGILGTGWAGITNDDLPDTILKVESVPHSWLFPQMAAIVHHGGAGTTGAALRSGAPSLVVPFFGDQFMWGKRTAQLGVGPSPLPLKHFTPDNIALALHTMATYAPMRQRAAALGAHLQAEDGAQAAAQRIVARTTT